MTRLVRVTRSPVTVAADISLEEGPRSCSATMHAYFAREAARLRGEPLPEPEKIERLPSVVHVVKLPRRRHR